MTTIFSARSRQYGYFLLDVFTKIALQGNPLAVVPDAEGLSEAEMQAIAGEFNLSETVFLLPASAPNAAVKARIFTPRRELPFAGHPTIGAASVVSRRAGIPPRFFIEELVGPVQIDADTDSDGDPLFWLTTPNVTFYESMEPEFCARLLGLTRDDISGDVPPGFVSAGSPLLFVFLRSTQAVDRAELQQAHLQEALGSVNSVGTFIFAKKDDSSTGFDVYSRMFAPQTGIPEDPATGGATGPLAAYMMRHGILPASTGIDFTSEQGTKMKRKSILHVRTNPQDHSIKVGGSTVTVATGTFALPESLAART